MASEIKTDQDDQCEDAADVVFVLDAFAPRTLASLGDHALDDNDRATRMPQRHQDRRKEYRVIGELGGPAGGGNSAV